MSSKARQSFKIWIRRVAITLACLATFLIAGLITLIVVGRSHVYRGPTAEPPGWDPTIDRSQVVAEGRKLIGIWYDPIQGYFGNLGGRLGMIVCIDVPVIAYRNAGASIKHLLNKDYSLNPGHYGKNDGKPGDPYFVRRARNLYSFCKHNGCLDVGGAPEPGDVVFMSRSPTGWISHIALVSEVEADGRYKVIEASRDDWYSTREHYADRMFSRGWVFRGFGRLLSEGKGMGL